MNTTKQNRSENLNKMDITLLKNLIRQEIDYLHDSGELAHNRLYLLNLRKNYQHLVDAEKED